MEISRVKNMKILYSCLNWGMGHVARSISLINTLEHQNNRLIIVGDSTQLKIIRTYFPKIKIIEFEGYPFDFSETKSFHKALWKQKKKLNRFMNIEKKWVYEKVIKYDIDLVLSDHRYGFRCKKCNSIFITHQVKLPLKGLYKIFQFIHSYWLRQFDMLWIVDNADKKLAGKLSSVDFIKNNYEFIGLLSRFQLKNKPIMNEKNGVSVLVLSGPNVHLNYLFNYYNNHSNKQFVQVIVGETSALDKIPKEKDFVFMESKNWLDVDGVLLSANEIFSFMGYSTLMDAMYLTADFHLIPCPNQWEQEYLGSIHPKIFRNR